MSVCVEYCEDGILFTGHFLTWDADHDDIRRAAAAIAPQVRCKPATIEIILRFELSQSRMAS